LSFPFVLLHLFLQLIQVFKLKAKGNYNLPQYIEKREDEMVLCTWQMETTQNY